MKVIRVGNASGFWGDNPDAAPELCDKGELDYLTLDYLAEVSMSILARQRAKDPTRGFARDMIDCLAAIAPHIRKGLRIVTNGGGLEPLRALLALRSRLQDRKYPVPATSVVLGDDLMPRLDELLDSGCPLAHLDDGKPISVIRERVRTANAYLGAAGPVHALRAGAQIVITGRVADPSLTVACARHAFGWDDGEWDKLAGAAVAGHLIECGAQATGGLFTDWETVEGYDRIGYPIAEIDESGGVVITKAADSGGCVRRESIVEQLLYEVGDPREFHTPDVCIDLSGVTLEDDGDQRVRVRGVRGRPPNEFYKVSATYSDGYMAAGKLTVFGERAAAKAKVCGDSVFAQLRRRGVHCAESLVEVLGTGACLGRTELDERATEVVLRVAVHDPKRGNVVRFSKYIAPLVTSGPPGVTGYADGRPSVREVFAYWPALIKKTAVETEIIVQQPVS